MNSATNNLEGTGAAVNARSSLPNLLGFLSICLLPLVLGWGLTRSLPTLVMTHDSFSPLIVVPIVSLFFIYEGRTRIFSELSFSPVLGAALVVPGLATVATARLNIFRLEPTNRAVLFVGGTVLIFIGAFGLFFGRRAFRGARFPLLFLLFSVPIPEPALSGIIHLLQRWSADAAEVFFRAAGIAYLRHDLIFNLPGVAIQVAAECSGIRSSLALLITTVLASHLFLKASWRKLLLCAVVVPLAILKNGLRIATLSTLAVYVDPRFLTGNLHHHGGIVFFLIAMVPLWLLLTWLQKSEKRNPARGVGA